MKKAVLAVTALFATVTAAPAMAAEFSYGGFMRYRYVTGNPGTVDYSAITGDDQSAQFMEYRVRQFFNLKVNDHVTTNVKLEWNSFFGDQGGLTGANGDLQVPGETELRIKNAFVRFDLPGAPLTLTVGQQDFSTPKAIISVEDYTGVKATIRALGGEHNVFWARLQDNNFQTSVDDGDWFGFVPSFKAGGVTISPHLSYVKSHGATARLQNAEVVFVGVDTSGKLGPVGFTADLIYQTGEIGAGASGIAMPCTATGTPATCDIASFILDVSASLAAGPGTLTLKGIYSPGDDNNTDSDIDSWVNVIATDLGWSPLFHDGTSISNFAGSTLPGLGNGGIMAVGAEFAISPYKGLTVTPNIYYLMAAEDTNAAGGNELDDFYGVEAGVQANWRLWDSVVLLAQFDYLFAGDVFKNAAGQTEDTWRFVVGPSISW